MGGSTGADARVFVGSRTWSIRRPIARPVHRTGAVRRGRHDDGLRGGRQDQNDGTTDDSENTGGSNPADESQDNVPDNSNQEPASEDSDDDSRPDDAAVTDGSAGALGDPEPVQAPGGADAARRADARARPWSVARSAASERPRGRSAAGTAGPAARRAPRATPGRRRPAALPSRSPSAARRPAAGTPDRSTAAGGPPTPARAGRGGTTRTAAARRSPGWGSARREAPPPCPLRVALPRLAR